MFNSKENDKFDLGVKGLIFIVRTNSVLVAHGSWSVSRESILFKEQNVFASSVMQNVEDCCRKLNMA